jgi:hypothetical protein
MGNIVDASAREADAVHLYARAATDERTRTHLNTVDMI